MNNIAAGQLPMMRSEGLVVADLADEVLVYDRERDRAHCLNNAAALVWRCCDGKTATPEIARRVKAKLGAPFNEELVWLAFEQLAKLHLLEQSFQAPPKPMRFSRRQMVRTLGLAAAVALPLVTSIVTPTAAQAATCQASGNPCVSNKLCCSPLGCNGSPGAGTCF